ncbi:hypothetical protein ACJX0J_038972, partial [Zea mays]
MSIGLLRNTANKQHSGSVYPVCIIGAMLKTKAKRAGKGRHKHTRYSWEHNFCIVGFEMNGSAQGIGWELGLLILTNVSVSPQILSKNKDKKKGPDPTCLTFHREGEYFTNICDKKRGVYLHHIVMLGAWKTNIYYYFMPIDFTDHAIFLCESIRYHTVLWMLKGLAGGIRELVILWSVVSHMGRTTKFLPLRDRVYIAEFYFHFGYSSMMTKQHLPRNNVSFNISATEGSLRAYFILDGQEEIKVGLQIIEIS